MVQDDHRPLRERQCGQGVGDRVDGEVALGLSRGFRARVGYVFEQVEGVGVPGRG